MSSSFEKSVKGGTKIKLAAPKSKYVEHILIATHAGEAGVAEIFRALQNRLRDSTWTIVFKSLIIVHLMIREGEPDVTLRYLANNPRKIAISNFSDVQVQGQNIRNYTQYILDRAQGFKETKIDFVRTGEGRLKKLTVDKGLLRETESVQHSIAALLKCDVLSNEPENEITLTAFRLLVTDLLVLFYVMNEGVINILEHFFEMSKFDADRALAIYKKFSKQTNQVVEYLSVARQYENATRLEVPKIKHAPTSLTGALEEYTNAPDFELNRRQYIAQQQAKKGKSGSNGAVSKPFSTDGSKAFQNKPAANAPDFSTTKASEPTKTEATGPAPDLIDFFESIEQNQQPMAHDLASQQAMQAPQFSQVPSFQQFQQTGYPQQQQQQQQQQQAPYGQPTPQQFPGAYPQQAVQFNQPQQAPTVQTNFTGAGFGGYTPQSQQPPAQQSFLPSIPQGSAPQLDTSGFQQPQAQPQATNPFRQSTMPSSSPASTVISTFSAPSTSSTPVGRQAGTNPFAKTLQSQQTSQPQFSQPQPTQIPSYAQQPPQQYPQATSSPQASQPPATSPFRPAQTGTNPFAHTATSPQTLQQQSAGALAGQATGTNPFRQSMMPASQSSPSTWQPGQPTLGGFEQLPTVSVFPRPAGQGQSQGQQSGW